jgi:pantoate kinase
MKALQTRIKRLELATLPAKISTVFVLAYDSDDLVTGFDGHGVIIERQFGESLAELERRCGLTLPGVRVWLPVYGDDDGVE